MWLCIALLLGAGDFSCPTGTQAAERTTADARERWCQRPDGVRHGPRQGWQADGSRWFEGVYAEGKRTGIWRFWHANGKLRSQGAYVDDKRDGPQVYWHESGAKAKEGSCKAGREDGEWTSYWPNGAMDMRALFAHGKLVWVHYFSRRGAAEDEAGWLAEKARGAAPGTARYLQAQKLYGPGAVFNACAD